MVQKDRNRLKRRDSRRNEERSRMTPGKTSTQTWRGKKTRSGRSASNDATGRMDKKHGSRTENGRWSGHPMHQEADQEQEEDRLSSREGVEERREGMGKRGRNDHLEEPDLRAKGLSPTRRHHSSPSWRKDHRTPQTIQDPGTDHQELLVAIRSVWHPMIRWRMPTMSASKNEKRENPRPPTTKHHTRTTLGTHHCRLHHRITNVTRIRCDNGSCWLIHQVHHSRPNNWRNIFHGNCQAFPRSCVETIQNPLESD